MAMHSCKWGRLPRCNLNSLTSLAQTMVYINDAGAHCSSLPLDMENYSFIHSFELSSDQKYIIHDPPVEALISLFYL